MNSEEPNRPEAPAHLLMLWNWITVTGLTVAVGSMFSFLLLLDPDAVAHVSNPYVGIRTYLVALGFLILGVSLARFGVFWQRHRGWAATPVVREPG